MGMLPVAPAVEIQAPTSMLSVASPTPVAAAVLQQSGISRGVSASGVVVFDVQSGQELYSHNPTLRRPMGSLTKLMTALIVVEHHALDEQVPIPANVSSVDGTIASLPAGSHFTVGDVLSALLISSGNDAALALAEFHSGSEAAFVQEMNTKAESLGLRNTSFANSAGLDDDRQWSTPRDIAWLAFHVLRYPALRERMSLPKTTIRSTEGQKITLVHTHVLLHTESPVVAGKTGTTAAAGQCLLSIVKEGAREYVVVLLGSRERYSDMNVLLRVFQNVFTH